MDPKAFISELVEFAGKLEDSPDKINLQKIITLLVNGKMNPEEFMKYVQGFIEHTRDPDYNTPTRRNRAIQIWEEVRDMIKRHAESEENT